jgi:hypothetical protein
MIPAAPPISAIPATALAGEAVVSRDHAPADLRPFRACALSRQGLGRRLVRGLRAVSVGGGGQAFSLALLALAVADGLRGQHGGHRVRQHLGDGQGGPGWGVLHDGVALLS